MQYAEEPASEIHVAARAYLEASLLVLAENSRPDDPPLALRLQEWRHLGDGLFMSQNTLLSAWQAHLGRLHELPEFKRLAEVLRTDPAIGSRLETLVGPAGLGRGNVTTSSVIDRMLDGYLAVCGRAALTLDDGCVARVLREFEVELRVAEIELPLVAPVLGLNAEASEAQLGEGIELSLMSDDEVARCLAVGLITDPFGRSTGLVLVRSRLALKARVPAPIISGPETPPGVDIAVNEARNEIDRRFGQIVRALRVFKSGDITLPGSLLFDPTSACALAHVVSPRSDPFGATYELPELEIEQFRSFLTSFRRAESTRAIEPAVRRFSMATERPRDDDRLVDLLVAAESLFLGDSGVLERGELGYRLSLRAAFFIDSPTHGPRSVYTHMRNAYAVRSSLVHGGIPSAKYLRNPAGDSVTLREFADLTQELLRLALRKAVKLPSPMSSKIMDWDAGLILPKAKADGFPE